MTERWSLSDMQVYGAEDQEEMDAIMRAMDRFEQDNRHDTRPAGMDAITVSFLSDDDRPAVVEMLASSSDFSHSLLDQYRRRGAYPTLIATRGSQIEGVLSGSFDANLHGNREFEEFTMPPRPHGFLARIFVHEGARDNEVGRTLIRAYAAEALSRRCTFIGGVLDRGGELAARRRFFKNSGFAITANDVFGAPVDLVLP